MLKLFTLSAMLVSSLVLQANNFPPYTMRHASLLLSVNYFSFPPNDSIPLPKAPPKAGLLKKLAQALQFRKNARTREQARVLDIIARSGLKDSLQATVRSIDSMNHINRLTADTLQQKNIQEVLNAIDSLKARLQRRDTARNGDAIRLPSTAIDFPVDDQGIQDLVNQVIAPVNTKEQESLLYIRALLRRKIPLMDTVQVSDSLRKIYTIKIRNKAAITGFYSYPVDSVEGRPDLRLIDELSWYAVGFKGATGDITDLNGWNTSSVIDSARARGCRITLCVWSKSATNITSLLENNAARKKLISSILYVLNLRHADGVHIMFDQLPVAERSAFTSFIISLSEALKAASPSYRLGIRIPSYDAENAWELPALQVYADQFLVDFTRPTPPAPGPLAPLSGMRNNDLKTCISRYLNMDIPPSKFLICLPYYGVIWKINPDQRTYKKEFAYITYSDLRSNPAYQQPPVYDPVSATQRLDIKNKAGVLIARLWYDDEKTLAAKYDFILQNKLAGVGIQALGYDEGYGELWDALASRFAVADTTETDLKTVHQKPPVLDDWQWSMPYITAKLEQYNFMFAYPCEQAFPKVLIKKWEAAGVRNNVRNKIRKEATIVLGRLSIVLGAIFLAGILLFISKIRRTADRWKWKKWLAGLLIVQFILFVISTFMFLFMSEKVIYFGVSNEAQDCFDFPLGVLFSVIFTGIAIGALITRFLVFPLLKKDDIP